MRCRLATDLRIAKCWERGKHPGCRSPVALTWAEEITSVVVRLEVGSDRFGGHSAPVTHLDPLRLGPSTDGLRLSGGCNVGCDAGSGPLPRSPGAAGGRHTSSGLLAGASLSRCLRNRCLGRGLGCRGPLGRRFLGSLRRRRPRPRVHPSGTRRRPVARRVRRFAAGARVDRFRYRGRLLRLARYAVTPVGTPKDTQGILVAVFSCINADPHTTHSQPSIPAPEILPSRPTPHVAAD